MVSKVLFQIFMVEMLIILFMLQMKWLNKSLIQGGLTHLKKVPLKYGIWRKFINWHVSLLILSIFMDTKSVVDISHSPSLTPQKTF
jgi:hypothetical protein